MKTILAFFLLAALAFGQTSAVYKNSSTNEVTGSLVFGSGKSLSATGTGTIAATSAPASGITGQLAVANGGTGVSTLTGYAKGSGATAFSGVSTIPILDGGTGATTASAARTNLDVYSKADTAAFTYNLTNSRAIRQGLKNSGSQTASTATIPAIGTGGATISIPFDVPLANPATNQTIFYLSTAATSGTANELAGSLRTNGDLWIFKRGATVSDYLYAIISGFRAAYAGQRVELSLTRASTVLSLFVNGAPVSYTEATYGTPPTWATTWDGTLFIVGCFGVTDPFTGFIGAPSVLNEALTAAEIKAHFETGVWPQWTRVAGGAGVVLNTSACTDGNYGAGFTGASSTGFSAVKASGSAFALTAPYFVVTVGDKFVVTGTLALNNGKTVLPTVECASTASALTSGSFTVTLTASSASAGTTVVFRTTGDADYTISNLKIVRAGLAFHADERWDGRGGYWPDVSGAGRHLVLATSGVTPAVGPSVRGSVVSRGATADAIYGSYSPTSPVLSATVASGTTYTNGQVLAEITGINTAQGQWRVDNGASCRWYIGGRYQGYGNDTTETGNSGYIAATDSGDVALKVIDGGSSTCKIRLVTNSGFTAAATRTYHLYLLDGVLDKNLVK